MASDRQFYMYVLACADDTLYTGYTTDLDRREREHQAGQGAKYTHPASRRPCRMIFSKAFRTKPEAMSAEYQFKQLTRPQKEAYLRAEGVPSFSAKSRAPRLDAPIDDDRPFRPDP